MNRAHYGRGPRKRFFWGRLADCVPAHGREYLCAAQYFVVGTDVKTCLPSSVESITWDICMSVLSAMSRY